MKLVKVENRTDLDFIVVCGEEVGVVEVVEGAGMQGAEELLVIVAYGMENDFVHGVSGQTRSLFLFVFFPTDLNLTSRMMFALSSSLAVWSLLAAALLALQATLFAAAPRLLLFLSNSPHSALSPLESFLAQQFAIFLAALAIAVLLNVIFPLLRLEPTPDVVCRPHRSLRPSQRPQRAPQGSLCCTH